MQPLFKGKQSWHVLSYNAGEHNSLFSKLKADCAAKSVDTASSIRLQYYNRDHYCNDRQGVKYVETNIPDKGSPAKLLCSAIIPRGVGTGGLWCVCVVCVQVSVCGCGTCVWVWHVCESGCV